MSSRTFNALASVVDSLRVWPEHPSFPEGLEEASPVELADARSRLAEISSVATELRRLVDRQIVLALNGAKLRYGNSILKAATGGKVVVVDPEQWAELVVRGLKAAPDPARLLSVLYSADNVRLSGLPFLAAALGEDPKKLRAELFDREEPTTPLSVEPIHRAAKYLRNLGEGETTYTRRNQTKEEKLAAMEAARKGRSPNSEESGLPGS